MSTRGLSLMVEMASRSLTTSYPACVYSAPEMVWAVVQISSVYPSGRALETWRAPMLPEAPGRFSTTTLTRRRCASSLAMMRPTTSVPPPAGKGTTRSEEHTSELQSQSNLVCRLLLEKKKKKEHNHIICKK